MPATGAPGPSFWLAWSLLAPIHRAKESQAVNDSEFWTAIVPELQALREVFGLPPFSKSALEIWEHSLIGRNAGDARAAIRSLASFSDQCPVPSEVNRKIQYLMYVFGDMEPLHHPAPESLQ